MSNDIVDPKVLCFLQDVDANSTTAVKYYLYSSSCDDIRKTKEKFPTNAQSINPEVGNCIADPMSNQTIGQMQKAILLLKFHFPHWLSIELEVELNDCANLWREDQLIWDIEVLK